jgi:hypothetical protein
VAIHQYAVLSDVHLPYEDKAFYTALDLIEKFPDLRGIYLNGDILEIESVSSHPNGPHAQRVLLNELEYGNSKFDMIQKRFKNIPVDFTEGNHCGRIFRYIRDVAPEMWGLIQTPKLLRFDDRPGWKFTPYGPTQLVKVGKTKDLYVRHEPLVGGLNCARGTAEKSVVSIIFGHTHTHSVATHKKFGPNPFTVTAVSGGWLGNIKESCFDYRGSKDNWQLGFTRVDCDEKTGAYEIRFIYL